MSKLGLEKEEELEQIANIGWIIEKAREFQKNIWVCFIYYAKAFVWVMTNCGKLLDGNTRPSYLSPEELVSESRRDGKNTQKNCIKKDLNELIYYIGVVSHPESDILECEVKWASRSTAVNKASGCNEIPAELFKSLKEDAIKVLHSLC